MSTVDERIELVVGDITALDVDAVVTAANAALAGGGGVDGAVHRAAGPRLLRACSELGGCPTGEARITDGFDLTARHVIHAVGPIWDDGQHNEPDLLRSTYRSSLERAIGHGLRSIAFPCISTGVYGFPKPLACTLAVATVREWLAANALPERVVFCCFDQTDADLYRNELGTNPNP